MKIRIFMALGLLVTVSFISILPMEQTIPDKTIHQPNTLKHLALRKGLLHAVHAENFDWVTFCIENMDIDYDAVFVDKKKYLILLNAAQKAQTSEIFDLLIADMKKYMESRQNKSSIVGNYDLYTRPYETLLSAIYNNQIDLVGEIIELGINYDAYFEYIHELFEYDDSIYNLLDENCIYEQLHEIVRRDQLLILKLLIVDMEKYMQSNKDIYSRVYEFFSYYGPEITFSSYNKSNDIISLLKYAKQEKCPEAFELLFRNLNCIENLKESLKKEYVHEALAYNKFDYIRKILR